MVKEYKDWEIEEALKFKYKMYGSCETCKFYKNCFIAYDSSKVFMEKHNLSNMPADFSCNRWDNDNTINQQYIDFEKISRMLIKYLNDNHHPHTKIIINTDSAEILEGIKAIQTSEFIKD